MYRNVRRFDSLQDVLGVTIVRFDAQLYFANTNGFKVQYHLHMCLRQHR